MKRAGNKTGAVTSFISNSFSGTRPPSRVPKFSMPGRAQSCVALDIFLGERSLQQSGSGANGPCRTVPTCGILKASKLF